MMLCHLAAAQRQHVSQGRGCRIQAVLASACSVTQDPCCSHYPGKAGLKASPHVDQHDTEKEVET